VYRVPLTRATALLALAASVAAGRVAAQGTARIMGVVRDRETTQPLEGVQVLLGGTPRYVYTDSAGFFVLLGVSPGAFDLVLRRPGYHPGRAGGQVSAAVPAQLAISLVPAGITLTGVEIAARANQPADAAASVQMVDRTTLEVAPVTTLAEVLELLAGVSEGHFRGGRLGQATMIVDGLDVRDQFFSSALGSALDLSPSALQELNVVTGGFGAQYGNAISGVVDVVTRRGSPDHWEGRGAVTGAQLLPDAVGHGFGRLELSGGGPVRALRQGATVFADLAATTAEDFEPRLHGLTCLGGSPMEGCLARRPLIPHHRGDRLSVFSRLDVPVSHNAAATLSAAWVREQEELYAVRFKYNLAGYLAERRTATHLALAFQRQAGGGSRANLLTARVALTRIARHLGVPEPGERPAAAGFPLDRLTFRGEDFLSLPVAEQQRQGGVVPGYEVPSDSLGNPYGTWGRGLFVTMGTSGIVQRHRTDALTLDASVTTQVSPEHLLVFGGQLKLLHVTAYERAAAYLPFSTPSTASFFPRVGALYVSNVLKPHGTDVTVTLGARLEAFSPQLRFTTERRALGTPVSAVRWSAQAMPRVGVVASLAPVGLDRTMVRFNFGMSTQPPPFQFFFDTAIDDSLNTTLRRQGYPSLGFERATSYELGVAHQLGPDLIAQVAAYYRELSGLVTSGVPIGPQGRVFSNLDQGRIKGIEASLELGAGSCCRRWRVSYAIQDAVGSVSTPFDSTEAAPGTRGPDVPLAFDRRHTMDLLAFWRPQHGRWSAAMVGTVASGIPLPGVSDGRRLPWSVLINFRAARSLAWRGYPFEVSIEGRNLLRWRVLRTARPESGDVGVDLEALEERIEGETVAADTVPRESYWYSAIWDLNNDGLLTENEQAAMRRAALLDFADPSLFYGPPRTFRVGVALSWRADR
jgi:outer membrane receptor protein involved in Fe transport